MKANQRRKTASRETGEERFADALTIIWMLSAVATLAAQAVAGIARAFALFAGGQVPQMVARVLPGWFLMCSVMTGIVCLILTPITYHVRRRKPPASIMVTAVMIGLLPLIVVVLVQVLRARNG